MSAVPIGTTKPGTYRLPVLLKFFCFVKEMYLFVLKKKIHNLCRTSAGLLCLALLAAEDKLSGEREGKEGSPTECCRVQAAESGVFDFQFFSWHCEAPMPMQNVVSLCNGDVQQGNQIEP